MGKTAIVICAHNVGDTLIKTVRDIPEGTADQVVLIDDASTDHTADLGDKLDLHVIRHPQNRGYGAVQKTGYKAALDSGADYVALLHGDHQYEPSFLPLLLAPLQFGGADMTFGSRLASAGNPLAGGMPYYRYAGNRLTTILENVMLGVRFTDMHSGMRAFTRRCLLSLPFLGYRNDFAFDKETVVDAVTAGLLVVEIPVPTRYVDESSSIPTLGSFAYVWHSATGVARVSATRGRRGRRWPVAGALSEKRPKTKALPSDQATALLMDVARTFYIPNKEVVVLGGSRPDQIDDLSLINLDPAEISSDHAPIDEIAGAVLIPADLSQQSDAAAILKSLRSTMHEEGLLVLRATASSKDLASLLEGSGFRLIFWSTRPLPAVVARVEPAAGHPS